MMKVRAPLLFLIAMFFTSSAMAAQVVLVAAPKGVPPKVGNQFVETLKRDIAPLKVTKIPAVKGAKASDRTRELGSAAASKKALYAVDAAIEAKKRLSVIAVDANGNTVYEKSVAWPKGAPKQKAALVSAAKEVAAALKGQAPPADVAAVAAASADTAPTPATDGAAAASNDAFSSGSTPPWMAGTSSSATGSSASAATDEKAPEKAPEEKVDKPAKSTERDKGGRGDFRIGIGAVGGGAGYKESIDSSRDQGDRDIKVSMAPELGGQLELEHAVGIRFDAIVLKQSATLKPNTSNASDIDLDSLFANARLSYALTDGVYPIAIMVGGGYEKVTAGTQPDVLWIPSSKLITTLIGATISTGDLTTVGPTFEIGLALLPYGKHTRTADTVKTSSRALGGQSWARLRYQWPKAMGSSAGFFVEAAGNARYMTMSPGDVTLPADDGVVRTLALPVGDKSSNRLDYGLTASVGIMWRPGD